MSEGILLLFHQHELLGTYILVSLHLNKVDTACMAGGIPYEAVIPGRFQIIYKLSRHPAVAKDIGKHDDG